MVKLLYWLLLFAGPAIFALVLWLGMHRGIALGQNVIFRREQDPLRFWYGFIGGLIGALILIAMSIVMIADCAAPGVLPVSIGCRLW